MTQINEGLAQASGPATVHLRLTVEQAKAVAEALDVYARLCIGQINIVGEMVRQGAIQRSNPNHEGERKLATDAECEDMDRLIVMAKRIIGYPANGSYGIGSGHVAPSAHRAWEVCKVLNQALAFHREPNPAFRGVHHDGLSALRYTTDPLPVATIDPEAPSPADRPRAGEA